MQTMRNVGLAALVAAGLACTPAAAMGSGKLKGEARLASPIAQPVEVKVAGATWRCAGLVCVGQGPAYSGLQDVIRECGRLSAAVGRLDGFKSRGRAVYGERLDRCNRLAGQDAPAPAPAVASAH